MSLAVIVLAAGQGIRMQSTLPKVLHPIAGQSLLGRILSTVNKLNPTEKIVVCGHEGDKLKAAFSDEKDILWVHQSKQQGTGHAVLQALPILASLKSVDR